jgi:hypothetical protein
MMTLIEIKQRRSAAVAELSEWFDPEKANFRADEAEGGLVVVARVSAPKARPIVASVIRRHFPNAEVQFEL